jgi:hypothetical protein
MQSTQLVTLKLSVDEVMTLRDALIHAQHNSPDRTTYPELFRKLGSILAKVQS